MENIREGFETCDLHLKCRSRYRMYANIEWRVGTEVLSWVCRTVLQDFKKSIGIFLLFQGLIALRFLNEILRLMAH